MRGSSRAKRSGGAGQTRLALSANGAPRYVVQESMTALYKEGEISYGRIEISW